MKIEINTTEDLLKFLDRDDVDLLDMHRIVNEFLNTVSICYSDETKEDLKNKVNGYLERFSDWENRPRMLEQKGDEFKISDLYNG